MEVFSHCLSPKKIYNRYTRHIEIVPCGECFACKNKKASVITKRVESEIKSHRFSYMFTLTYNNDSIPRMELFRDKKGTLQIRPTGRLSETYTRFPLYFDNIEKFNNKGDNNKCESLDDCYIPHIENDEVVGEFGVVSKVDIQRFVKRLRKKIHEKEVELGQSMPIRYFIASEYGPKTFRPHYHGIIFFDNEVLTHSLQGLIVASWGISTRKKGKTNVSLFRPYASTMLTRGYIKSCDPNTAYYVADYVSSNDSLPTVLRHPLTRPFYLCSQGPLIGSYQDNREKMLEDVRDGIATYYRERVDQTTQCVEYVSVPYTSSNLCSVFLKCKEFYALSSGTKLSVYSLAFNAYNAWQEWVIPIYQGSGFNSLDAFTRQYNYYSLRNFCKRNYSKIYSDNLMDEDINWYASLRCCKMIKKFDIFRNLGFENPVDGYLYLMHRGYTLIEIEKMKSFHNNLSDWLHYKGVASLVSAYPTVFDTLPNSVLELNKLDNSILNFINDYGLKKILYKNGNLDYSFLEKSCESSQDIFVNHCNEQKQKFYKRSKQKKANNSYYQGFRKLD